MSELSKPTRSVGWAFLFALRHESRPFTRGLRRLKSVKDGPCSACIYQTNRGAVLVAETGVGAVRASTVARWAIEHFEPRLVIACGFAGALSPTLKVGDVLLASEVVEPDEEVHWRTAVPVELGDLPVGRLVTVKELVGRPAAKRSLARQTGAIAVDMESAAIAEVCQERRVPCAVVRAISDDLNTELSHRLVALLSGGRASPGRVLAAVARSPRLAVELWRLARNTRLAGRNLAEALHRLMQ
jgi:adenosylhomocysteine nucleosidase